MGVTVTIGNQISEEAVMEYEFDKGELIGVPAGFQKVTEMGTLIYHLTLSDGKDPTADVEVNIQATSSSDALNCTVSPSTIRFIPNNATQFEIKVQTFGNKIDEGTNAVAYT